MIGQNYMYQYKYYVLCIHVYIVYWDIHVIIYYTYIICIIYVVNNIPFLEENMTPSGVIKSSQLGEVTGVPFIILIWYMYISITIIEQWFIIVETIYYNYIVYMSFYNIIFINLTTLLSSDCITRTQQVNINISWFIYCAKSSL